MTNELPATVIYAYPPEGSPYSYGVGVVVNPFMDDMLIAQNMFQNASEALYNGSGIWGAFETRSTLKVMEECFKGLSGKTYAEVEQQFRYHCEGGLAFFSSFATVPPENKYLYVGNGAYGSADWMTQNQYGYQMAGLLVPPLSVPYRAEPVDFYGTMMMPLAAIGYWIFGGGQPRNVHIGSLNLQMLPRDFQPIATLLNDPGNVGSFEVGAPFSYNIFDKAPLDVPAAGMLGRVSGNVKGTLDIQPDGTYVFNGSYSLNSDFYDADKSNRTWAQEALTTFLKGLGDTFGHDDYYINVLGEQSVQYSGKR
ncbi:MULTISPECIES: lipid II-degrading bacteriocin [unclassified Pseudomonas]|jgi:hypothetical protein|uniref:lipid II-degrading bacteriocin n=1 Tax=unclassified Pseudomonas TaxID=196821 RepID=UPI001F57912A|nr:MULTISPECIES: lipid II-degrading bacteriocin [unclassified Pseudomonas]